MRLRSLQMLAMPRIQFPSGTCNHVKYYLQVNLYIERLYSLQCNNYQIHLPICNKRLKVLTSLSNVQFFRLTVFLTCQPVFQTCQSVFQTCRSNNQTVIATYRLNQQRSPDHNQLYQKSSKYYWLSVFTRFILPYLYLITPFSLPCRAGAFSVAPVSPL